MYQIINTIKKILLPSCILVLSIYFATSFATSFSRQVGVEGMITVQPGSHLKSIMRSMIEVGLIKPSQALVYGILLRATKLDTSLKCGEFSITKSDSSIAVFKRIIKGEYTYRKLTIPEGMTNYQIMQIINKEEALLGPLPEIGAEILMPDTYVYRYCDDTKASLLGKMHKDMITYLDKVWQNRSKAAANLSPYEIIVLASIIERETNIDSERALIASVFLNRLAIKMPLRACPTVIYAISEGKGFIDRPLYKSDLSFESPFNTYRIKGLPPGPICNPGRLSIMAALHPAETSYLYFVQKPDDSGHYFSKTYDEHLANVNRRRNGA